MMKRLIACSILFVVAVATAAQSPAITPCKIGKNAPAFGFWTWGANSTIKVYILTADFNNSDLPYLLTPLQNWNAVAEATLSGVTFDYRGATSAPLYCENCLTIMRGPVFDGVKRHATELRAYSARRDQIMTWAQIVVDPVLTNPRALTNAIAHELGHNFGLIDCYTCKQKSTVMNQFKAPNVPNDMEGPTACDVAQVRTAYKELAVRVRPSPQATEVVDEGEEPVDDDTPVVIRKPF
ncbi:MAG TPA: hypothetical protein VGJ48_02860 [Pyrinomonadaceae bacterium]|jgi:hypothetical protein|nr:hypothetical protein [Pyrinomonadaceae bacterium]